ncbi:MAG: histidine triad (HIT) family protein [Flavobacteriales bacterium]|jgi:histidine triad (HIT) family protein
MATLFTQIINGSIPCHKIAENDEFLSFLDISPLAHGHTLVVPKQETDYLFDLDDALLGRMMIFAKNVALQVEKAIDCKRIGVAVIGLEVPHAHIHLVPLQAVSDINFERPKLIVTHQELADVANRILNA